MQTVTRVRFEKKRNMASYQKLPSSDPEKGVYQFPYAQVMVEDGLSVVDLYPSTLGGVFCPGGTIANHEPRRSLTRRVILHIEVWLQLMFVFINIVNIFELHKYQSAVMANKDDLTKEDLIHIKEDISSQAYLDDCVKCMTMGIISAWFLWNIVIRVFYFTCYTPQREHKRPTLLMKIFFPLATVHYHEQNKVCSIEMLMAFFFDKWYALLCYVPSYLRR